MGVRPFYKQFSHNGVNGPNMATVYSDRGYGVRAPVVCHNHSNEAAALLKPGDFDWEAIFGEGVLWFHSGGIFAALSETTGEVIIEGMRAAKAAGVVTSFDLNYRGKLWELWGGHEVALGVLWERLSPCRLSCGGYGAPSSRRPSPSGLWSTWTSWWATRRICRWVSASPGRRCGSTGGTAQAPRPNRSSIRRLSLG